MFILITKALFYDNMQKNLEIFHFLHKKMKISWQVTKLSFQQIFINFDGGFTKKANFQWKSTNCSWKIVLLAAIYKKKLGWLYHFCPKRYRPNSKPTILPNYAKFAGNLTILEVWFLVCLFVCQSPQNVGTRWRLQKLSQFG